MQTNPANPSRILSPAKRPLRAVKLLPKNIAPLQAEVDTLQANSDRIYASSFSPRKKCSKKKEDFEMCSSGAVLVLARKVKTTMVAPTHPFKKTARNCRSFQDQEDEVFCQRSQQKYRIRSKGRSFDRMQFTLAPQTAIGFSRMKASEDYEIKTGLAIIEPWNLSMDIQQLSDLF